MSEWERLRDKLKNDTEYFDSTIDLQFNIRPQNWFELDYDI